MQGKELCTRFFKEAALPILNQYFPDLSYTVGFTGYGSDVLGYDDEVSQDHMWGPRFHLFLKEQDMGRSQEVMECFSEHLPKTFCGYSVNFSEPDPEDNGIRHACEGDSQKVSPLIFINTLDGFLTDYLGCCDFSQLSYAQWLAFSENRLLILKKSVFWKDDLGLAERIKALQYYPEKVWEYLIASNWELISQEQAFVKRCGSRGDDIGSRICCTRIAERLMRLCFLYCKEYAPYSKWFGTAFQQLPVWDSIKQAIANAVAASDLLEREHQIALAQKLVCDFQDSLHIAPPVNAKIQSYFGRDIQVIFCDRVCALWSQRLKGSELEGLPLIGNFSGVGNFVCLYEEPGEQKRMIRFYKED